MRNNSCPLLTDDAAHKLTKGSVSLGGQLRGLFLRAQGKQKVIYLSYISQGIPRLIRVGTFPELSIPDARRLAVKRAIELEAWDNFVIPEDCPSGDDIPFPKAVTKDYSRVKLKIVVYEWLRDRYTSGYWDCDKTGERVTRRMFEHYIFPSIGDVYINDITTEMIARCLYPIWREKHPTATKLKGYLKHFFSWAIATKRCSLPANPASDDGGLNVFLMHRSRHIKPSENHAACSIEEIPQLMLELHSTPGMTARACEFGILTAARSQAVRCAQWSEFDFRNRTWTIPTEHDKIKQHGRNRVIYLSHAALNLLRYMPRFEESELVFPGSRFQVLTDASPLAVFRRLHEKRLAQDGRGWIDPVKTAELGTPCTITFHGTARAGFRTWAKDDLIGNNRKFDQEAVELCLLHSKNDSYRGAYDRAQLRTERLLIMEEWGKYCTQLYGDAVPPIGEENVIGSW